ncbi:transporter [Sphingobium sp. EM0848]|uniref:transporter n=1 Tax=Sphingobium sp. EM0848 TaxID=2743473 RepID=UPI00159C294D|nr:transporter [Sphingobium sp. EM0848]
MQRLFPVLAAFCLTLAPDMARADPMPSDSRAVDMMLLRRQIADERRAVDVQQRALDAQKQRLNILEDALLDRMRAEGLPITSPLTPMIDGSQFVGNQPPAPEVGIKPPESDTPPHVAVIADQGILSRPGRLVIEPTLEYLRSDRNRFVFRGIEIPQSVLVGVFDINESHQDILTAGATIRYGLTSRFEISARLPWVFRRDTAVLVPLVQNPPESGVGTVDTSTSGSGLGDIELQARYQLTSAGHGWPYMIAGMQVIAPTGSDPFGLPRDALGNAEKSATGSGFWAVQPSLTMLMPSDPATLFAVLGYTYNFGRNVDTRIGTAQIDRVEPGGAPNATVGLGISLNPRLSMSLAYAHNWQFGTKSRIRPISIMNGIETLGEPITSKTRDLQIGRLLFGLSYRASQRTTLDWIVEVGATEDAPDLRTTLRVPFEIK